MASKQAALPAGRLRDAAAFTAHGARLFAFKDFIAPAGLDEAAELESRRD